MPGKTPKKITTPDTSIIVKPDEPSLLFAIQELIRTGGINFDEWFDEWQKLKQGKAAELSKYPKIKLESVKPKFYDITPKESKSGCRMIWFMPDGEELSGIPLSGTESQIINHIVAMEYEGGGEESKNKSSKNTKPGLSGLPMLELIFVQDRNDMLAGQKSPVKGEKRIRIVGYTDNDRIANLGLAQKIQSADVKRIAESVVKNFSGYKWKKGQGSLSYMGLIPRFQGLEGYAYVDTRTEGKRLFAAMLNIFGNKPEESCFAWSIPTNPALKFPSKPEETVILDNKIKSDLKRPITIVEFDRANVELTTTGLLERIVKRGVVLYK